MRETPPATTAGIEGLRPLLGVVLLLAVVVGGVGVVLLSTGGPTVEITARPAPDAAADAPAAYDASEFESPSPVVELVERADSEDGRVQTTTTVENRYRVRLAGSTDGRTYHVALADPESGTRFYRVTVEIVES
ncbi:hypothetical protein [Salinirubrum litoreum]|uniref:Uncharacterized protein n=1 Tax=Salinirubrum litoreum TaxID=1126234 RepID=A0ABD5R601_9EURY|nr:hypothetical protein [Salinirubrum litoreum]